MSLDTTQHISSLVTEISHATKIIQDSDAAKESARKTALAAAKTLTAALENPQEVIYQHAFSGPERLCVRLAISLRIFHLLAARDSRPVSAQELSKLCGAEQLFIVRIMRVITAENFVKEAGEELYIATPITKALTIPPIEAAVTHTYDHAFQAFPKLPEYFETHGYKCPTDPDNGPFQYALGTKLGFYDYLGQDPKRFKDFDMFMSSRKANRNRPLFENWFPVQERMVDGFRQTKNDSDVLMIDIGGGMGQDIQRFKQKYPDVGGRLILQDLPRTVANAVVSEGIETMGYDFFTPQPVKGARVYYFHDVHHNWPDHKVKEILRNIVSAMKPGFSKLILNDYILPEKECPRIPSWADIHMMTLLCAIERTEKQWRELLESVGLRDVTFWYPPETFDGVVEAVLGDDAPVANGVSNNGRG